MFLFILIILFGCSQINSNVEYSFEEKVWNDRIDAAFSESDCPIVKDRNLPNEYYNGPMIDTHIHIPHIPDASPYQEIDDDIENSIIPSMGVNVNIDDYLCMMNHENTSKVFAFFPVWEPITPQLLEVVNKTMLKYPDRFVPFIMPSDGDNDLDGFPTVESEELNKMLNVYPDLFSGYGEIGLYARKNIGGVRIGAEELLPDSERLKNIYPVLKKHNLLVYFHLGEDHKDNFENVLRENPDINFIWHGGQLIPFHEESGERNMSLLDEVLYDHPNAFYGVDELYGGEWLLHPDVSKEQFLNYFKDSEKLLEKDLHVWKDFIERHPDQVLWGTDRGWSPTWSVDPEVAITLNNYTRAFIGRLDPAVQEKIAYKNAERLLQKNGK